MSRAKHQESLNAVQLFPFVAVLLCTMGSLLVLLVGVARSSKVRAVEEAAVQQAAARVAAVARKAESKESIAAAHCELEKIAKYQTELDSVRTKAADQLRQDQLRLSHLEDHMRRLREQLDSLKLAAAELNALEGEHYDDRKQALEEVERLEQLIADSRNTIEQLHAEAKSRARSYAIVPYQGHRGTFRRPIYIECREKDVVLQPEGVVFTVEDFQPPIGPGNPLVAAIRAAREHIVRYESIAATGKEAEPYPLIIVRPKGVKLYYYVREAIQSWDSEFGYELVEEDWELKFAPADPQLATAEYQAAELSRGRLRALAAAAPQAYGAYRSGGGGGGGDYGSGFGGGGGEGYGDDFGSGSDGANEADNQDYEVASPSAAAGGGPRYAAKPGGGRAMVVVDRDDVEREQGATEGKRNGGGGTDDRYATKKSPGGNSGSPIKPPAGATTSSDGEPRPPGSPQQPPQDLERQPDGSPASGSYAGGDNPEQELDDMARAAAAGDEDDGAAPRNKTKARGKNWALRNANPGTIPIRRTIQVVVRGDALAILPEASATNEDSAAGREFQFGDMPEAAYEDLVSAVDKRIEDWGMAGQGLYWRPVVELKVSADGEHRYDDLVRLLKYSGAEIRSGMVAQQGAGGARGANR